MDSHTLIATITGIEPDTQPRGPSGRTAVRVPVDKLASLLRQLRDGETLAFDLLMDHTAIDWPEQDRFELVYQLYSTRHGHDLAVCTDVPRNHPVAPTSSGLWPIAEYQEREVYDLFGIQYEDHPDLRRVFLEDDWNGFPLRKDYEDPDMLDNPRNT